MRKKNFISKILCLLLLLGTGEYMRAQGSGSFIPTNYQNYHFSPENLGFAAPQTAEFVKYGNTSINYYSGLLDLDIPLMNYKNPAFDLGVSLKYISDGFKPGRRPSVVGNNWVLSAGGSITRNVAGTPDDVRQKYMKGLLVAIRDGQHHTKDELLNLNFTLTDIDSCLVTEYDMDPDIFEFNFGKHKGRFIIDNTGNAKCISGGGYKIDISGLTIQNHSKSEAPKSSTIKIKTPDGYLYTFGGTTSELEYNIPNNLGRLITTPVYIVSWYLSSIKDETGNNTVNFSYQSHLQKNKYYLYIGASALGTERTVFKPKRGEIKPDLLKNIRDSHSDRFLLEDKIYIPILKSISVSGGGQINFVTGTFPVNFFGDSNENDLIYLSGITMKQGQHVQSCKFDYQLSGRYFFLKKLTLHDQSENPAIYSFDYDLARSLPDPLTTSVDHWGFWNGGNEGAVDVDGFLNPDNIKTRRAVNTGVASSTMLKQITYPTKGKEIIDYEYNRYKYYLTKSTDSFAWNSNMTANDTPLGGVRIKKLTLYDPSSDRKRQRLFTYLDPGTGMESGRIHELPRYNMPMEMVTCVDHFPSDSVLYIEKIMNYSSGSSNCIGRLSNISEHHVGYSHVKETFDDGSFCRYHFTSLADVPDNSDFGKNYCNRPKNLTYRSFNQYQLLDKELNYAPNDLSAFRGKLLSKKTYNNSNQIVAEEKYDYNLGDMKTDYEVAVSYNIGALLARKIFTTPCLLTQEKLTDENGVTVFHNYKYNDKGVVTEKETINSNGDHVYLKYAHPGEASNLPSTIYNDYLINANRIEEPVSIMKYLKKPQDEKRKIVDFIYFLYDQTSNAGTQKRTLWGSNLTQLLPEDTDLTSFTSGKTLFIEAYDNYDKYGNVVTLRDANGNVTLYLWSYYGQYVIAEIKGSTYEEVKFVLAKKPEDFSNESEPSKTTMAAIEQLRTRLPHAQITTYDYKPQVGVKYSSEPNGKTSYFKFDNQGRLKQTFRKGDKGELQLMEYNKYHFCK